MLVVEPVNDLSYAGYGLFGIKFGKIRKRIKKVVTSKPFKVVAAATAAVVGAHYLAPVISKVGAGKVVATAGKATGVISAAGKILTHPVTQQVVSFEIQKKLAKQQLEAQKQLIEYQYQLQQQQELQKLQQQYQNQLQQLQQAYQRQLSQYQQVIGQYKKQQMLRQQQTIQQSRAMQVAEKSDDKLIKYGMIGLGALALITLMNRGD